MNDDDDLVDLEPRTFSLPSFFLFCFRLSFFCTNCLAWLKFVSSRHTHKYRHTHTHGLWDTEAVLSSIFFCNQIFRTKMKVCFTYSFLFCALISPSLFSESICRLGLVIETVTILLSQKKLRLVSDTRIKGVDFLKLFKHIMLSI